VLAPKIDYIIGEIECDSVEREVRVLDSFRIHDVAVSVIACEHRGTIGPNNEFPELKLLAGNPLVVGLNKSDFVQEPKGSDCVCNILCAQSVAEHAGPL